MEDLNELLINNLKTLRAARGITQEQAAELADISPKHYQSLEAGRKRNVRLDTLSKLANAFDLEPWELLRPIEKN